MVEDADKLKRPLGATGETVRANITRLRTERGMAYTDLSARLKELKREIPPLGLRRIENGGRRVDADDLCALAAALGVSPVTLLLPDAADGDEQAAVTGVAGKLDAEQLWKWVQIEESINPDVERLVFRLAALPTWKRHQLIKYVDAKFEGGGDLDNAPEAQ